MHETSSSGPPPARRPPVRLSGYLAKSLLAAVDVAVVSHVVSIGGVTVPAGTTPRPADQETVDESPVRAFDGEAANAMVRAIEAAKANRDTLGGVVEVLAYGVPPGVGSHVHHDRRLDAALAGALMSIQGIKGVEIGNGFAVAAGTGSEAHDEIYHSDSGFDSANRPGRRYRRRDVESGRPSEFAPR